MDIKLAFNPSEWRLDLLSGPDGIFVPESSRSTLVTKDLNRRRRRTKGVNFKRNFVKEFQTLGREKAAVLTEAAAGTGSGRGSEGDANEVV